MIKNLTIYRVPTGWTPDIEKLKEKLSVPNELGDRWKLLKDGLPIINVGGHYLLVMETQEKLIPSSVVKKEVQLRIEKFVRETGDAVMAKTKRFKRDIQETVLNELWPKAFVTSKFTNIWIDSENGYLCIDTTSENKVLAALKLMHESGITCLHRVIPQYDTGSSMHGMLISEDHDQNGFCVGRDCELVEEGNNKRSIKYKNENLDSEEIRNHLTQGKRVRRLELTYDDRVSFVLHSTFAISGLELIGIALSDIENACEDFDPGDKEAEFNSTFMITAGEYSRLITALIESLGGEVEHGGQNDEN
ncbi:recombination-associated protein RdgC [Nitrosomonas marina]|uniref:Recombination-associated protein RdgC n=1 Tax=Nitrosomonas marina TaxID=917 RepID=A0A1H8IV38_9PROT|nr:recombination-associated protein RdgC [Nitrosomonas marina]SEN71886.1 recombination associated protein RdgC [Nitrosomonas marina]